MRESVNSTRPVAAAVFFLASLFFLYSSFVFFRSFFAQQMHPGLYPNGCGTWAAVGGASSVVVGAATIVLALTMLRIWLQLRFRAIVIICLVAALGIVAAFAAFAVGVACAISGT